MKPSRLNKILKTITSTGFIVFLFTACLQGNTSNAEVMEFNGVGLRQATPQSTMITGIVKYAGFTGGNILVEARYSVPCTYGRCPVIGEPPIASIELNSPGMYALQLPIQASDLMVIATFTSPNDKIRIASNWIAGTGTIFHNTNLDLGEIAKPLR